MTTRKTEAIFIPLDLEASLGRIEDENGQEDMMDCEPATRTSENNPFKSKDDEKKNHHIIAPYPLSETDAEINDRQRLAESGVTNWTLATPTEQSKPWCAEDLELIPDDGDDFSLSSQEAGSLNEEDLQLEKIKDPASFWDATVPNTTSQPNIIPFSVSFSSALGSSQRSLE